MGNYPINLACNYFTYRATILAVGWSGILLELFARTAYHLIQVNLFDIFLEV